MHHIDTSFVEDKSAATRYEPHQSSVGHGGVVAI